MDTIWGTVKGLLYVAVFGIAGYAVVINDRLLIGWLMPIVLGNSAAGGSGRT